jgi:hypothetical protein
LAFPSALVAALPTPLAADFRGIRPLKDRIEHGEFEQSWYKMLADIYSDYEISRAEIEQREKRSRVPPMEVIRKHRGDRDGRAGRPSAFGV